MKSTGNLSSRRVTITSGSKSIDMGTSVASNRSKTNANVDFDALETRQEDENEEKTPDKTNYYANASSFHKSGSFFSGQSSSGMKIQIMSAILLIIWINY